MVTPNSSEERNSSEQDETCDMNRRTALQRLGKFAAYVPPTVLVLLHSRNTVAGSIGSPPPDP